MTLLPNGSLGLATQTCLLACIFTLQLGGGGAL